MSSQALYRKWRPRQWSEVVAQDTVVTTLRNAIRSGRVGHAYLLSGPRGTGKTTTARLLAKALNCTDPDLANRPCDQCANCQAITAGRFLDLIEIDAASNTSVDDVRALREKINFSPSQGRYKVYIIDEVHMLSTAAFNALLKTLEEPPAHAIFILATTELQKIPATVLSRVQQYEFRRIPLEAIRLHLRKKAEEEGIAVDDEALTLIARQATGAMRDAIGMLDQLSSGGKRVTLLDAQQVLGTAPNAAILHLVDALVAQDAGSGLAQIQAALDAGSDSRQVARQVVDYLHNVLLVKMGNAALTDATPEQRAGMTRQAQGFTSSTLVEAIRLFNAAATDTRSAWHPGLGLELALAECLAPKVEREPQRDSQSAAQPVAQSAAQREPQRETPRSQSSQTPAQTAVPQPADQPTAQPVAQANAPANPPTATATPPAKSAPPENAATSESNTATATGTTGKLITSKEIQQNWPRVRQITKKQNAYVEALLNSCRVRLVEGENTLILGFNTTMLKSKMDAEASLETVRQALQAIFGVKFIVRTAILQGKGAQPADIDPDGMVSNMLDLGGRIIHEE